MIEASLTKITAQKPHTLTKSYHLEPGGALVKTPGGPLVKGIAETVTVTSLDDLAALVKGLGPENAVVYGITGHERARIVTSKALPTARQVDNLPVIARNRKFFTWPKGAGVLTLDFDGVTANHADEIFNLLVDLHPAFNTAPMIVFPSASSGLYHGETCLKPLNGWRALVLVADALDIPRNGETLFKMTWLQGRGFIHVSRSGAQLTNGPLDKSVYQPERLDFVSGADCKPPLEQRRPDPVLYNKDAAPLDTRQIESLSPADLLTFETMVKNQKTLTDPEAQEKRDAWTETRIETELAKKPDATDDEKQAIRERFKRASKYRYLQADYELETLDGEPVTVEDILKDREKWNLQYIKDPFDPGDRPRARLYTLTTGKPYLWSFSEGARYTLSMTREKFQITPGGRCDIVEGMLRTARESGGLFLRGGEVVAVNDDGEIRPLETVALQFVMDGHIQFFKFDARSEALKPADCPKSYAEGLAVAARLNGGLPNLKGIITHPTFDPATGRIIDKDGFDEPTGLLLRLNGETWPEIQKHPEGYSILSAAQDLLWPLREFPFASPVDLGVSLAAMLTAVIRALLETAPLFMYSAPTPGTGKTLRALMDARLIGLQYPAAFPGGGSDETEIRKRLLSIFRGGARMVLWDNLNGTLQSDSLCTALTSPYFEDRILGASNIISAPTNTLFIATGNNIRPGGDLCRRTLKSQMDSGEEKPWRRQFSFNPLEYVDTHRPEMIGAALTILKGTFESGFTVKDGLGSFEDWNRTARAAVCYLQTLGLDEVADPALSIEASLNEDPETGKLRALLTAWFDAFGDTPRTVAAAIETASRYGNLDFNGPAQRNYPALYDALDEIAGQNGKINVRMLSRWIEGRKARIIDGLFFELSDLKTGGINHWRVKLKK